MVITKLLKIGALATLCFAIIYGYFFVDTFKTGPNPDITVSTRLPLTMYQNLKNEPGNLCFSPLATSLSLGILASGTKGLTSNEIQQTLSMGKEEQIVRTFKVILAHLETQKEKKTIELNVASALWLQEGLNFEKPFLNRVKTSFNSEAKNTDFGGDDAGARKAINDWVSQKTKGLFSKAVSENDVNKKTQLALTTAIYFKGRWTHPFNPVMTKNDWFWLTQKNKISVPMMQNSFIQGGYTEDDDAQVLELHYDKSDLAMVFILPKKRISMSTLESKLTENKFAQYLSGLKKQKVEVTMPRFKITQELDLIPLLKKLGVITIWNHEKADLNNICSQERLYISNAKHMAEVTVDEEGVVAAAVEIYNAPKSEAPLSETPPPVFVADHPFVFFIRDRTTGAVLFMGRVLNPKGILVT